MPSCLLNPVIVDDMVLVARSDLNRLRIALWLIIRNHPLGKIAIKPMPSIRLLLIPKAVASVRTH